VGPSWRIENDLNKLQNTKRFMDKQQRPIQNTDERDRQLRKHFELPSDNVLRVE